MPIPLALGIAAAPSIVKGIAGIAGIFKGNKMAKNNPFPTETVNQNYVKNSAIADQMALVGLPQQQYNNSIQNIGRNQSAVLNQLSRSNNSGAGLQSLLRASNDATMNLDAQDAQARLRNQGIAMQQRGILGQQQDKVWDWNNKQKYIQQANAAAAVQGAGRQNAFGALTDLSQLGQSYLGGQIGGQNTGTQLPGQNGYINKYLPVATTY